MGYCATCVRGRRIRRRPHVYPATLPSRWRTYAFFPVAFGKEFQQTHLLAPGSVRQPHPTVFSLHLTHVPQCHRIVCRSFGRTPPVEFISEQTRGGPIPRPQKRGEGRSAIASCRASSKRSCASGLRGSCAAALPIYIHAAAKAAVRINIFFISKATKILVKVILNF